ncbi:MAG: hypothetical protein GXO23_01315 [Crenarchaeota archaeon]|nr:hypothetical protein [Thermoproteota archaeon]
MRIVLPRYLNCEPIRIGLRKIVGEVEILDIEPSRTLEILLEESPELCMIPVAQITEQVLERYYMSDICIASVGPVRSVGVYYIDSVKVSEIDHIYSTKESATSVKILKHIFETKYQKKIKIERIDVNRTNLQEVIESSPTFLIGDLALEAYYRYRIVLDVGEEWYNMYSIPLIYAVLTYRRDMRSLESILRKLRDMLRNSSIIINMINEINTYLRDILPIDLIVEYLTKNIVYVLEREIVEDVLRFEREIIESVTL